MVGEGKLPWGDFNSVINNLCLKLNTTFDELVPEIVRMQIAKMLTLVAVIVLICAVVLLIYRSVHKHTDGYSELDEGLGLACVALLSILVVVLIVVIPLVMSYLASPRAAALRWIIGQLK